MIAVSAPLAAALAAGTFDAVADLYTLTLADASVYRWTSADIDVVYSGNTYTRGGSNGAPIVERGKIRQTSTLEVDTLDVTLLCGEGAMLGAVPLTQAAANQALDGATFRVDYAFPVSGAWEIIPARFIGNVSDVNPESTLVSLTVKSDLEDLARPVPPRTYQVQCGHPLFSPGCGLAAATYAVSLTALAGATTTVITATGAQVTGYFTDGYVILASGERATILSSSLSGGVQTLTLATELSAAPGTGSGVTAYPGCDKLMATCLAKFANLTRFGGFPFIPRKTSGSASGHNAGTPPSPPGTPPLHDL